jgi:hypothetical protein
VKTIDIAAASKPLSQYAEELGDEVIVLVADQTPFAALVSLKKVDRESLVLSTSPEFLAIIEDARREFREGKKLSYEAMKQAVAEMP